MAVAHDAYTRYPATDGTETTTGNRTFTHTPVGTTAGVVVIVHANLVNVAPCTGVLYGGVAMAATQNANNTTSSDNGCVYIYTLTGYDFVLNGKTGAQTVTIQGATSAAKWYSCISVTTTTNYSALDSSATKSTTTGTPPSISVSTTAGTTTRGYSAFHSSGNSVIAYATGSTLLENQDYGSQVAMVGRRTANDSGGAIAHTLGSSSAAYCAVAAHLTQATNPNARATPSVVAGTTTIPTPAAITHVMNQTVTPTTVAGTTTIPTPTVTEGFSIVAPGAIPAGAASANVAMTSDLGLQFNVTQDSKELRGYWYFIPSGGDTDGTHYSFAVYSTTNGTTGVQQGSTLNGTGTKTANAWNYFALSSAIALTNGTTYVAVAHIAVNTPYEYVAAFWTSGGGASGITKGPITSPNDATALNHTQDYNQPGGASPALPTSNYSASWYGVDVKVDDASASPDATATPDVISGSTSIGSTTINTTAKALPSVVSGSTTINTPTVTTAATWTFGTTDASGTTPGGLTGLIAGTKYHLDTAGDCVSLVVYTPNSGQVTGAIYEDNSGVPGAIIVANNTPVTATAGGWTTVTIATTALGVGDYWLTFMCSSANRVYKAAGTNQAGYDSTITDYWGQNFPTPFPSPAYQNNDYVCYANMQGSAGSDATATPSVVNATTYIGYPRSLHRAIDSRDSAAVSIPVIGDSVTEGCWVTTFADRWTSKAQDKLRSLYPTTGIGTAGGYGYIPLECDSATQAYWPVSLTSGSRAVEAFGPTLNSVHMSAACTYTFTAPAGSTGVKILYNDSATAGSFRYRVNSGSYTTITNAGTGDGALTSLIALSAGDSLTISWVSGHAYVEGILHYAGDDAKGIAVHALGRSGWTANDWKTGDADWRKSIAALSSGAIGICLGINDSRYVTASAYAANLTTLIDNLRSDAATARHDIILIVPYETSQTFIDGSWAPYETAALNVAASRPNVWVVNLTDFMPSVTADPSLYYGDGVHIVDAGGAVMGDLVARWTSFDIEDAVIVGSVNATTTIAGNAASASSNATPGVVSGTTSINTPTATASSKATPNVIPGTTSITGHSVTTTALVTPTVINATTSVNAATVIMAALVTPDVISSTVTIPGPSVETAGNAQVSPACVSGSTTIGGQASASHTATPATVNATAQFSANFIETTALVLGLVVSGSTAIPTPQTTLTCLVLANVIAGTASIPGPTMESTTQPTTVAGTATIPTPAIISEGTATATPATVAATTTIGGTASASSKATPSVVGATLAVGAVVPSAGAVAAPETVSAQVGTIACTASAVSGTLVSAACVMATVTVPGPASMDGQAAPVCVSTSATIPSATAKASSNAAPDVIAATVTIPEPTFTSSVAIIAQAILTASSIPNLGVLASSTATPNVVDSTADIPEPEIRLGQWALILAQTVLAKAWIRQPKSFDYAEGTTTGEEFNSETSADNTTSGEISGSEIGSDTATGTAPMGEVTGKILGE